MGGNQSFNDPYTKDTDCKKKTDKDNCDELRRIADAATKPRTASVVYGIWLGFLSLFVLLLFLAIRASRMESDKKDIGLANQMYSIATTGAKTGFDGVREFAKDPYGRSKEIYERSKEIARDLANSRSGAAIGPEVGNFTTNFLG